MAKSARLFPRILGFFPSSLELFSPIFLQRNRSSQYSCAWESPLSLFISFFVSLFFILSTLFGIFFYKRTGLVSMSSMLYVCILSTKCHLNPSHSVCWLCSLRVCVCPWSLSHPCLPCCLAALWILIWHTQH